MLNLQVFTICACILSGTIGDKCLRPAKEGSTHTFVETFNSLRETLIWKTGTPNTGIHVVIQCVIPTSSDAKQCVEVAPFPNQYSGTIQKKSGEYTTLMTIKNVTSPRDETTLWWYDSFTVLKQCDLDIYSIKSDPSCNKIQVESNTVSWQCSISNFYPKPLCQFELKKDDENYQTVSSDHINKDIPTLSGDHGHYSRSCTMNVPVSTLQPGRYIFKVTMYPGATGTSPSLGKWLESDDVTLCTPHLSSRGVTHEFELTKATDLEILIDIIGYPEPTGYTLTKVKSGRRRKVAVTGCVVDEIRYSVTYLPKKPSEGIVVLRIVDLLDEDSGQYGLTIENGVGDGLVFIFNVTIVPEKCSCDDETNMGTAVGVAVGCCLLLSIVMFILGMQVDKRCKSQIEKTHKMLRPSPDYDDFNVPPLQEAYVDVDSIQLQEARRQQQEQADGYEIPQARQQQQQQQDGGYEIHSHHGDHSKNPTPEYVRFDDGYETPIPFQYGDNTTNTTYEDVDIDGQPAVNTHSNN